MTQRNGKFAALRSAINEGMESLVSLWRRWLVSLTTKSGESSNTPDLLTMNERRDQTTSIHPDAPHQIEQKAVSSGLGCNRWPAVVPHPHARADR